MSNETRIDHKITMLKKRMNDRLQHDPRITEISAVYVERSDEISVKVTRIDGEKTVSLYPFATNAYELASLARIDAARFASKIDITRAFEIENERRADEMLAAFNGIENGDLVTQNARPELGHWQVIARDYASKLVRIEYIDGRTRWIHPTEVTKVEPVYEVEPLLTVEEQAEADAALAALEAVAARQDAEARIDELVAEGELSKAVRLAADTITETIMPDYGNRLEGGTVTRHYYAVRTVHGTHGVECATIVDAMKLAADRLDEINSQRRAHGILAPLSVQVDTRITVALVGGGSEDFPIDKMIVTPGTIARIRARRQ